MQPNVPSLSAPWLAELEQKASIPALLPRWPLTWQGHAIGTVEQRVAQQLISGAANGQAILKQVGIQQEALVYALIGDSAMAALAALATALRQLGLQGGWRDELLAVCNEQQQRLGAIERGVVRVLGVATTAVHLVGFTTDGRIWVQQRSLSKSTDPGLWDTLMGGMVSDVDTVDTALVRETWEEAGLHLDALQNLALGGEFVQRRPSDDGAGAYLIETTHWYHAMVPDGLVPVNQDGEVAQFACMTRQELVNALHANQFTLEASLILVEALKLLQGAALGR
jgi:8-oxo-dGTP pyrophosphatase MutT (NUDIX family)